MGSRAMESKKRWFNVEVWRKREAYIALIRFIRGHLTYPQWDCYKLEVYSERQSLNKTFLIRHLPLSNGENNRLDAELVDPPRWSDPVVKKPPMKRVKKEKPPKRKSCVVPAASHAGKPQVWDVEKGCFVPF